MARYREGTDSRGLPHTTILLHAPGVNDQDLLETMPVSQAGTGLMLCRLWGRQQTRLRCRNPSSTRWVASTHAATVAEQSDIGALSRQRKARKDSRALQDHEYPHVSKVMAQVKYRQNDGDFCEPLPAPYHALKLQLLARCFLATGWRAQITLSYYRFHRPNRKTSDSAKISTKDGKANSRSSAEALLIFTHTSATHERHRAIDV